MLDENLRVLTRRINDLESDLHQKKQKILALTNEKEQIQSQI
jgi:prefoldin subunit 5